MSNRLRQSNPITLLNYELYYHILIVLNNFINLLKTRSNFNSV